MPTYVYKCDECDHMFEEFHSYKEKRSDCSLCNKQGSLKKQFNIPIQVLKNLRSKSKQAGSIVKSEINKTREQIKQFDKDRKKENNRS